MARADEEYQKEFEAQGEELQTAEGVIAKRRGPRRVGKAHGRCWRSSAIWKNTCRRPKRESSTLFLKCNGICRNSDSVRSGVGVGN